MLLLHQYYLSPFCEKLRRQLHWKGIEYQTKEYPLMARKQVQQLSPAGKLPCLEHDGKMIGDSTDAAYYIEEKFPKKSMLPDNARERAQIHVLEDWADESLYFYEMYCRFYLGDNGKRNFPRMLEEDGRIANKLMPRLIHKGLKQILTQQGLLRKTHEHIFRDLKRHLQSMEGMLSNDDWLVGGQITLADVGVYPMMTAISDGKEAQAEVKKHPAVVKWMKRVEDATGGKTRGAL